MDVTCENYTAEDSSCDKFRSRHCHRQYHYHHTFLAVVVFNLFYLAVANPVFVNNPSLAQFQSGRNIRHLPCIVRKTGLSGVCMFAIDCIKSNGTHLGTCIDRFYFGSCCQMKDDSLYLAHEINDNSIDQNTISHFPHEATTVPASALFKLTTQSYSSTAVFTSPSPITSSTTERLTSNVPNIPVSTVNPPQKLEGTTISSISTGTNLSALLDGRPSSTTNLKPQSLTPIITTPSTTTTSPILTTIALNNFNSSTINTNTESEKFTTFQIVQSDFVTTTPSPPRRPPVITSISSTTIKTTSKRPSKPSKRPITSAKPTNSSTYGVTTKRAPTKNTTQKQRLTTTRRTTSKRPGSITKRPITLQSSKPKPSRRPTIPSTLFTASTKKNITINTTSQPIRTTTTSRTNIPITTNSVSSSTKAPRPRPKPTSQIVKVPPTTIQDEPEEKQEFTTFQSIDKFPETVYTTTQKTLEKKPTITTTTEFIPTKLTTSKTTGDIKLTTPSTTKGSTAANTVVTTTIVQTTTPHLSDASTFVLNISTSITLPTTSTVRPISAEESLSAPVVDSTTQKPALVTWTNIDELKQNSSTQASNNAGNEWQPRPPPDWVPLPTIKPETDQTKTEASLMSAASMTSQVEQDLSSTEGITNTTSFEVPQIGANDTTKQPLVSVGEGLSTTPWSEIIPLSTSTQPSNTVSITNVTEISIDENTTLMANTQVPSLEGIDYRQICGKRMFPEPRIVGGANAAFGRWPWQISLRQWRTSTYLHKCGAALLNENWAITAAHCVDNVPPSDLLLRLGEYDLAEEEEPYGYQERRVQIVASHPQFDPRTFEYDLALLRFYEPVVFQPNIIPVCVPESDTDFIGETAFVTGWGRLYEDGPLPSVLQEVSVPVINNSICETMYRSAGYIEHIPHIFICAGWKKGGYDSCEGDSGGPMVLQRDDKRFLLAGIISWGIGCAEPNQPGVYTRISEFRDWINQILQF